MKKDDLRRDEIRERAALYALGALSDQEAREFEAMIAGGSVECEEEFRSFASIVAKIGLAATREHPPAPLKDKLFDELETRRPVRKSNINHRQFRDALTIRMDEGRWVEMWPGVSIKRLFADRERGTVTTLFRMAAGSSIPAHRHHSIEECLVIEGDYHINGQRLGPGDYHCAMPGSVDETLTTVGGATFLLVSAPDHEFL